MDEIAEIRRRAGLVEADNRLLQQVNKAISLIGIAETPTPEWVRQEAAKLSKLPNPVQVFRLLGVDRVPTITNRFHTGQHWTTSWDSLAHHGNFYTPRGKTLIVLQGMIQPHDISIPTTLAYRFAFPEENEIFLDKDATVFLGGVLSYPEGELLTDRSGRYLGYGLRVPV
jgi:hypothetical protein